MAALAAVALDLGDGNALDPHLRDGLPDIVEFERLDDGCDEFHALDSYLSSPKVLLMLKTRDVSPLSLSSKSLINRSSV